MKTKSNKIYTAKNTITKKLAMLGLIFAFIISSIFSMGLFATNSALADDTNGVLRFKQIEAGDGFVIAVTYEGELYAWSTTRTGATSFNEGAGSLAAYYPSVPTKIEFDFYTYDDANIAAISDKKDKVVAALKGTDAVKKVATTPQTAALITEKGYVYTWGFDGSWDATTTNKTEPIQSDSEAVASLSSNNLLFRTPDNTTGLKYDVETRSRLIPQPIMEYLNIGSATTWDIRKIGDYYKSAAVDISSTETNYMVQFNTAASGGSFRAYVSWGSSFYILNMDSNSIARSSSAAPYLDERIEILGGSDYYLAFSGSEVYFKGKNFYLPEGDIGINSTYPGGTAPNLVTFTQDDSNFDAQLYMGSSLVNVKNAIVTKFTQTTSFNDAVTAKRGVSFNANAVNAISVSTLKDYYALGKGYIYYIDSYKRLQRIGLAQDESVKLSTLTGIDLVQVVAGRQPSTPLYVSNTGGGDYSVLVQRGGATAPTAGSGGAKTPITFEESGVTKVKSDYVDSMTAKTYVSAVLTEAGQVRAWDNTNVAPKVVTFNYKGRTLTFSGSTKIERLTAGYGNNLFALDTDGKIYHIVKNTNDEYVGTMIDTFYTRNSTGNGTTAIDNWSNEDSLSVTIKSGYQTKAQKAFKIGIDNSGKGDIIAMDATADGLGSYLGADNNKFISSNATGDVYRIMLKQGQGINYTSASAFNDGANNIKDLKTREGTEIENSDLGTVEFYLGGTKLTSDIVQKYMSVSAVYTEKDLHFEITPLRSTMAKTIKMVFYIGRFSNITDYASQNALFYDAQKVSVDITIQNTQAKISNNEIAYTRGVGAEDSNTSIPLLDPNNPHNTYYSIALTNVSAGFTQISTRFTNSAQFMNLVYVTANSADMGFPASTKVGAGALTHTLGTAASTYYSDTYKYLFPEDIDGNEISYSSIIVPEGQSTYADITKQTITLSLNLTSLVSSMSGGEEAFKKFIGTGNDATFMQIFSNTYGFRTAYDDTDKTLTITYDVIRVQAKAAGDQNIGYVENNDSKRVISEPIFKANDGSAFKFSVVVTEKKWDASENEGYAAGNGSANDLPFYIKPSLRFKNPNSAATTVNGVPTIINYQFSGNNEIRLAEENPRQIRISDLFTASNNIMFAYNGMTDASDPQIYDKFINDYIDSNIVEVTLNKTTLTFQPRRVGIVEFTVEVRRFSNAEGSGPFVGANGLDTEVFYLRFVINCTSTKFEVSTTDHEYTITGNENSRVIDIKNRISVGSPNVWQHVKIELVQISDSPTSGSTLDKIANVTHDRDALTIAITPIKSGQITVWYYVSMFDTVIADSFKVVIESISHLPGVRSIPTYDDIYLSSVKVSLRAMNPSSSYTAFDELYLSGNSFDEDLPEGVYVQQFDEDQKRWETVEVADVEFIDAIRLAQSGEYVRVLLGDISSNSVLKRTRVVLNFVSDPNATKSFDAAIEISPTSKMIMTSEGAPLNVMIEYGQSFEGQDTRSDVPIRNATTNTVTLPLKYFVSFLPTAQRIEFEVNAKIGYIRPDEGYEKYFTCYKNVDTALGQNTVVITPNYPTPAEGVKIKMSVETADGASYIFTYYISISGITTGLEKSEYIDIFLITAVSVFAMLVMVFFVRLIFYSRRKAQQKRIIKKNQMLIKMRDKMHNKTSTVSKGQLVKTKMKMEDPKYAKMFTSMRSEKEAETGISLDNSALAQKAEKKSKSGKKKKGKGSNIDQLKAELEAKKMAFAQMQGGVPPVMAMDSTSGIEMDQSIIDSGPVFDSTYQGGMSREDVESQIKAKLAEENFLEFETIEPEENNIV